jgi:hypothetical protein
VLSPVKTLFLPARYTPDSIALHGAAIEAGWQVERLLSWHPPSHLRHRDAAIYGEPLFGAVVAEELSLFLLEPPVGWLAALPWKYALREVSFTTLGEAKKYPRRAFIKPADDKCFPARVYENGSALPVTDALPDSTPVLISEPVVWEVEFRFFILERQIASFSPYAHRSVIQAENRNEASGTVEAEEVVECCNQLLADSSVLIPPSVAIDIGKIESRGWAVVEANAAWASGIYGCDPGKVLDVIARACVRSEEAGPEERRWIVDRTGHGNETAT